MVVRRGEMVEIRLGEVRSPPFILFTIIHNDGQFVSMCRGSKCCAGSSVNLRPSHVGCRLEIIRTPFRAPQAIPNRSGTRRMECRRLSLFSPHFRHTMAA